MAIQDIPHPDQHDLQRPLIYGYIGLFQRLGLFLNVFGFDVGG